MEPGDKSGVWISRGDSAGYTGGVGQGNRKTRILVVDDHLQYRRGLISILEIESDLEAVGEAGNGREAIEQVERLKPDLVLMDVNMPQMDGMEATRVLSDTHPDVSVIILTMFVGEEHLRQARRAGASAYVLKDAGSDVLLRTIHSVVRGEMPLLQNKAGISAGNAPEAALPRPTGTTGALLTSNERSILKHLANGLSNDQIAREVGMSDLMVRTYMEEIYRKLGLSGRDAAAQYARKQGWGNR